MPCSDVDPQEFGFPEPEAVYHVPSFSAAVPLGSALCLRCRRIVWLAAWLNDERCPAGSAT